MTMPRKKQQKIHRQNETSKCGLCGKTRKLKKTECCDNWICDDEDKYVLFSFARNSCARNHDHYTLCRHHYNEQHEGDWRKCEKCAEDYETEMYVWRGTNEYNFVKLENPPAYEPTRCKKCNAVIKLGADAYTRSSEGYFCENCSEDIFKLLNPQSGRKRK